MRFWVRLAKGFLYLLAALVGIGFLLPKEVHVERSVAVEKPVAELFNFMNGYEHFNKWSPWHGLDPQTQYTYEGPAQGVGAKMSWVSAQDNVGSGSQEIIEVKPNELIRVKLDFGPDGSALASYTFVPEGTGARVTWGFDMSFGNNIAGRYFGLFMEKMIGPDYEKGLSKLKEIIDGPPKTQ